MSASADESVHPTVRKAAAWAWRLLVLFAAALLVLLIMRRLEVIVVPVAIAMMMSALLLPGVDWLSKHGVHRGLAVFLLLLGGLAVLAGLLSFVVDQFIDGVPELVEQVTQVINSTQHWLVEGPLHLSSEQIDSAGDTVVNGLRNNQAKLTSGALSTAETITKIITGAFVVLFTLIFFLYGGRNIWQFTVKFFPSQVRERVHAAGIAGFESLIGYVRATFLVALVDALGIGIGLAVMAVPLALPLASLVFLGAFIPLVGAVLTGLLAVLVALIAKGWIYALVTLGLIIAVNQLEAHVLQPLVMGRAVSIHPLAVVLGISTGGILAGIVGALLAVPTIAFIDRAVRVLVGASDPDPDTPYPADPDTPDSEADDVSTDPPDAAVQQR
ncbi:MULTISPECIES: AI-2E family transporter [Mycolicibacter]|uniref:AI-2E family transporter n=1 Tax=Mycolicibacter virginiensis TaxID=1795032 RepID=A0A9X7NXU8_9MYCO|nr:MULTISPECIES: AI-2E family transporter [Mycobacteriaceae]OBG38964.1 AI-2E family transporter [Mycolicibacter heraklionensis]OBJ33641.1 AI-2E family transporter [Mycolicibacter heraklionensis]PQM51383.1 AI-2E family transporter [Mycolicibacter virginiensis]ULP47768.1 AI-2E family transporter [Mycolicibacter virginiensis]